MPLPNIIQMEDDLKNVTDDQLVEYMQNPPSGMPQFLTLQEMDRRREMRESFQATQGQPSQNIAQELTAYTAGEGQQGIGSLPAGSAGGAEMQSRMNGNTPVPYGGGEVQSMMQPQGQATMGAPPMPRGMASGGVVGYQNRGQVNPLGGGSAPSSSYVDSIASMGEDDWVRLVLGDPNSKFDQALNVLSLSLMAVPVAGWAGAGAVKGAQVARSLYRLAKMSGKLGADKTLGGIGRLSQPGIKGQTGIAGQPRMPSGPRAGTDPSGRSRAGRPITMEEAGRRALNPRNPEAKDLMRGINPYAVGAAGTGLGIRALTGGQGGEAADQTTPIGSRNVVPAADDYWDDRGLDFVPDQDVPVMTETDQYGVTRPIVRPETTVPDEEVVTETTGKAPSTGTDYASYLEEIQALERTSEQIQGDAITNALIEQSGLAGAATRAETAEVLRKAGRSAEGVRETGNKELRENVLARMEIETAADQAELNKRRTESEIRYRDALATQAEYAGLPANIYQEALKEAAKANGVTPKGKSWATLGLSFFNPAHKQLFIDAYLADKGLTMADVLEAQSASPVGGGRTFENIAEVRRDAAGS